MQATARQRTLIFFLLVALYAAGGAYSSFLLNGPGEVALFWPASGVALAGVVRFGLRWAVFVPLGGLLLHGLFEPVSLAFLPYSLASNYIGVLAGGWFVLRQPRQAPLTVMFGLRALLGGVLMAAVSAGIGVFGLLQAGQVALDAAPAAGIRWFLGDLLGVASVAPAMMIALWHNDPRMPGADGATYAPEAEHLLWNVSLTASFLLMAWAGSGGGHYALGLVALPLSVLVWSAIRFPPLHTAVAIALTMLLITGMAGLGLAGYPAPEATRDGLNLLAFLIVVAVLPMILAFAMHQQRVTAATLRHRANIDPLTGLANRNAFEERVRADLANPSAPPMALAYLDLDHFKLINDTASHVAGDAVIRGVAGIIEAHRHRDDLLARTGGDEFALLLRNCSPMVAEDRARALLRAIEGYRCGWDGQMLASTASIGLVAFLPGQAEYAQLLSQADAACFTAKEQGGNRVCQASLDGGEMLDRTSAMRWVVRIREALEHHAMELHCQSIVPLRDNGDRGRHFEVLVRLRDPRSGQLMMPSEFMPAAERFNLVTRIDREVIGLTLAWLEANPQAAASVSTCCINLSGDALIDEGFIGFVAERLRRSSFPGDRLCFEVTETSAVRDLARAQRFITEMRALGCRFALDDFGTGFCSFNYVRALDVDYFKIDGSFVRDMDSSPLAEAVVRSINEIAHVLDKRSIAEHTESERDRQALIALGVDYAQGYGIDRPVPIADYFAKPFPGLMP
ncbi:MAG: EAL domain-containing protein [Arenimonas sp.]|uniref:putative bifunctional diguanylate cyclase/phosphodiesterase n=1 Tax=Arenimonas sp. TaxID=1872635 RepID=UPI0025B8B896|nr:EAL domain-containing protein [Arenimonas sp.]MBW8366440.1 EAL domain-containing protein [Arenimonas sp.]